ncbi:MAG: DNA polymerase III subunit beta [Gammaproteobacteria bacterium]|jgi:DNA polymerase III subunit beta|nr:DNA polymerase III subunit beta [Gammaproteobacteria bacterium]MBT5685752.1 DNA polymerase III subunit beta [Gammaproteobacteria bacterium]MBT6891381.1 DNA polymerase III subunit beta [Gammaproteobacteria bacterium]MBT7876699.1 DNA polymerase III subunit beta [Gammaproteobacteria bacterium]MDG1232005.1 DNA polymerase III subunit beta [Pseudomonadales bacterium]
MKFSVNRELLLKPLQQVAGVVERRQTLPVLSNLLLQVNGNQLSMTGTDLEVELIGRLEVDTPENGEITVPARKLVDICREIPEKADIEFSLNENRLQIRSGRFRSTLSTLPAVDFPSVDQSSPEMTADLDSKSFKKLLDQTAFAMAQQDVRYFLNGMLIELGNNHVRTVATDGHRLAMSDLEQEGIDGPAKQVIVPRKGVIEIQRLLQEVEDRVAVSIGNSHLCATSAMFSLTTKLVDGKFPDYDRVIPKDGDKVVLAEKQELRQALSRTAILSNEKFRGIRVSISTGQLQLSANNPEQEEAEETVSVDYQGDSLEVGFNVSYLQDVLGVIGNDKVRLTLHDANSSAVIEDPEREDAVYVVMPMKL